MRISGIQRALALAGDEHKYQKSLTLLMCVFMVIICIQSYDLSILFMIPTFTCSSFPGAKVLQKDACPILFECLINQPYTITGELSLYCDRKWVRSMIQFLFPIGACLGLIVVNLISDLYGKRYVSLICAGTIVTAGICTLIGVNTNNIFLLGIGQIINGIGNYSGACFLFIMISSVSSIQYRSKAFCIIKASTGMSCMLIGFFYIIQISWKSLLIVFHIVFGMAILTIFYFFLLESPYFLINKNRKQECFKTLQWLAQFNKIEESSIKVIKQIVDQEKCRTKQEVVSLNNIFKMLIKRNTIKTIFVVSSICACSVLYTVGSFYGGSKQSFSAGANFLLSGMIQTTVFIAIQSILPRTPRRMGTSVLWGISALLGSLLLIDSISTNPTLSMILVCSTRITIACAGALLSVMNVEYFPIPIQSTVAAIVSNVGVFAHALSPFLVGFSIELGLNPLGFISIIFLIPAIASLGLRQTLLSERLSKLRRSKLSCIHTDSVDYGYNFQQENICNSSDNEVSTQFELNENFISIQMQEMQVKNPPLTIRSN